MPPSYCGAKEDKEGSAAFHGGVLCHAKGRTRNIRFARSCRLRGTINQHWKNSGKAGEKLDSSFYCPYF
jgi:hypothetical protein